MAESACYMTNEARSLPGSHYRFLGLSDANHVEEFTARHLASPVITPDLNGDGMLTFGELMSKLQAWGIEKDPKEYMGIKNFQDETVITKDEWFKFVLTAVFLLEDPTKKKEDEEEDED